MFFFSDQFFLLWLLLLPLVLVELVVLAPRLFFLFCWWLCVCVFCWCHEFCAHFFPRALTSACLKHLAFRRQKNLDNKLIFFKLLFWKVRLKTSLSTPSNKFYFCRKNQNVKHRRKTMYCLSFSILALARNSRKKSLRGWAEIYHKWMFVPTDATQTGKNACKVHTQCGWCGMECYRFEMNTIIYNFRFAFSHSFNTLVTVLTNEKSCGLFPRRVTIRNA